ncbi:hypothetical protein niasHT_035556 [Heterodera trifolii]|uniref:Paired domain-containing protein n=1 Tax=Heterodera trifolii TaxID=157864 RepID=A0ABD2I1I4_9BILA
MSLATSASAASSTNNYHHHYQQLSDQFNLAQLLANQQQNEQQQNESPLISRMLLEHQQHYQNQQQQQQLLLRAANSLSISGDNDNFKMLNPLLMPPNNGFHPLPMLLPLIKTPSPQPATTTTICCDVGRSNMNNMSMDQLQMMMNTMIKVEDVDQLKLQVEEAVTTNRQKSAFVAAQQQQQPQFQQQQQLLQRQMIMEQMLWELLAQQHLANTVSRRNTTDNKNSYSISNINCHSISPVNELLQQQLAQLHNGQVLLQQHSLIANCAAATASASAAMDNNNNDNIRNNDRMSSTVPVIAQADTVQRKETVMDDNDHHTVHGTNMDKRVTSLSAAADQLESFSRNKLGRSYNPGRPLGMLDRQKILNLYQRGLKISHIAKVIGVTHSCVSKIMTRYRRTGSIYPRSAQLIHRRPHQHQSAMPPPISFINDMEMADQDNFIANNMFDEHAILPSAFRPPPFSACVEAADHRLSPIYSSSDQSGLSGADQRPIVGQANGAVGQQLETEMKHPYLVKRLLDC